MRVRASLMSGKSGVWVRNKAKSIGELSEENSGWCRDAAYPQLRYRLRAYAPTRFDSNFKHGCTKGVQPCLFVKLRIEYSAFRTITTKVFLQQNMLRSPVAIRN